ncbi:MAG: PilZ domain-containing protein [Planctomycetota bacterium]|nr:PilZ domain-containing protein [Planctomycetota bacterium]
MAEITIGEAIVTYNGRELTMRRSKDEDRIVSFTAEGISILLDWITSQGSSHKNERAAYRIRLPDPCELRVSVRHDEKEHTVTLVNISHTGISLNVRENLFLNLEDHVVVRLEFNDIVETLRASVRRRNGANYGLLFIDSFQGEEIRPPERLAKIIMALQRKELTKWTR